MSERTVAALFVLVVWWLSTAGVLRLVWLGRGNAHFSVGGLTILAMASACGLVWSSRLETPGAAYVAFGCALTVWGWHELTFLLGLILGPRRTACPAGAHGWQRFVFATEAIIHHEILLALTLLAVTAMTWGQPNQVGTATFLVLWIMRLSAKLNVFLGVQNLTEQFVPSHLRYLLTYFRRSRLNPLMPVSVLGATAVTMWLAHQSSAAPAATFLAVARSLVATLLALAVLEHVFLALPLPDAWLWRWAIRRQLPARTDALGIEAP